MYFKHKSMWEKKQEKQMDVQYDFHPQLYSVKMNQPTALQKKQFVETENIWAEVIFFNQ